MSEKQSLARKAFWANMSPLQKSERMRSMAKTKQKKMTFQERRTHAIKMRAAKNKRGIIL